MKIRSLFIENQCRKPVDSTGFTYFISHLYFDFILAQHQTDLHTSVILGPNGTFSVSWFNVCFASATLETNSRCWEHWELKWISKLSSLILFASVLFFFFTLFFFKYILKSFPLDQPLPLTKWPFRQYLWGRSTNHQMNDCFCGLLQKSCYKESNLILTSMSL